MLTLCVLCLLLCWLSGPRQCSEVCQSSSALDFLGLLTNALDELVCEMSQFSRSFCTLTFGDRFGKTSLPLGAGNPLAEIRDYLSYLCERVPKLRDSKFFEVTMYMIVCFMVNLSPQSCYHCRTQKESLVRLQVSLPTCRWRPQRLRIPSHFGSYHKNKAKHNIHTVTIFCLFCCRWTANLYC